MKKTIFALAIVAALTSCGGSATTEQTTTDSTKCCDSTKVCDTTKATTADSTVVNADTTK